MEMGRLKKPLGTAIDRELSDAVDDWIKNNPPWRKVDVIESALRAFIEARGGKKDG